MYWYAQVMNDLPEFDAAPEDGFSFENCYVSVQKGKGFLNLDEYRYSLAEKQMLHDFCMRHPSLHFDTHTESFSPHIEVWQKQAPKGDLVVSRKKLEDVVDFYGDQILDLVNFEKKELRIDDMKYFLSFHES